MKMYLYKIRQNLRNKNDLFELFEKIPISNE